MRQYSILQQGSRAHLCRTSGPITSLRSDRTKQIMAAVSVLTRCLNLSPAAGAPCPAAGASCPAAGAPCPAAGASCPAAGAPCPAACAPCPAACAPCPAVSAPCPAVSAPCPAVPAFNGVKHAERSACCAGGPQRSSHSLSANSGVGANLAGFLFGCPSSSHQPV